MDIAKRNELSFFLRVDSGWLLFLTADKLSTLAMSWMNVLSCVWALKRKLHPNGTIKKIKSRLCAGDHQQIKNWDYPSVFSPVVSWSTVRLLLILLIVLNLPTRPINFTSAFLHAVVMSINHHTLIRWRLKSGNVKTSSSRYQEASPIQDKSLSSRKVSTGLHRLRESSSIISRTSSNF